MSNVAKEKHNEIVNNYYEALSEMTDAAKVLDKACLSQILWEHKDKKPQDIMAFLRKAQLVGADPRLNEIYLVAYGNKSNIIYNYQFIMNKAAQAVPMDAIEVICEKREVYDPVMREDKTDLVATARTYINGKEYKAEAEFGEFYNARNPTWKNYTKSMLEKCAIVKLCRRIPNTGVSDMQIAEENPIYHTANKDEDNNKAEKLTEVFSGKERE